MQIVYLRYRLLICLEQNIRNISSFGLLYIWHWTLLFSLTFFIFRGQLLLWTTFLTNSAQINDALTEIIWIFSLQLSLHSLFNFSFFHLLCRLFSFDPIGVLFCFTSHSGLPQWAFESLLNWHFFGRFLILVNDAFFLLFVFLVWRWDSMLPRLGSVFVEMVKKLRRSSFESTRHLVFLNLHVISQLFPIYFFIIFWSEGISGLVVQAIKSRLSFFICFFSLRDESFKNGLLLLLFWPLLSLWLTMSLLSLIFLINPINPFDFLYPFRPLYLFNTLLLMFFTWWLD